MPSSLGARAPQSRVRLALADDAHIPAMADFYRATWSPEATPADVSLARRAAAATNVVDPGVPPPTMLALRAGVVLGMVTSIPVRLWDGQAAWPAHWINGLMVRPDARNGPIGFLLLRAAVAQFGRSVALTVTPVVRGLYRTIGCRDLGSVQDWLLPVDPDRIARRLDPAQLGLSDRWWAPWVNAARHVGAARFAGRFAGAALRGLSAALRRGAAGIDVARASTPPAPEEIDALWNAARADIGCSVERDARYLLSRYRGERYHWIVARDHGALCGVAVLQEPRPQGDARLNGIRVAALSELLFAPGAHRTGLALLGGVEHAARGLDAHAVLAAGTAASMRAVLRRQCYLPVSATMQFFMSDPDKALARFAPSTAGWWVTRGDANADGAL